MPIRTYAGLPLEVRNLRAGFAERGRVAREILDVRHLRVDGGSQLAICGPSGSGKTTLLHLLAGLERPWRGSIRWGEIELNAFAEGVADRWRRETVGLVFQQFHLLSGMSALENVVLPVRFDRWSIEPALRARALKLLERVAVRPDSDVGRLSRGEHQRVAVATALLRRPEIVLADEPTASLDRDTANIVGDLLSSMCRGANATLVAALSPGLLVDARGRKRRGAEDLRGRVPMTIDVEADPAEVGCTIEAQRYGRFMTERRIGDTVRVGQAVGGLGNEAIVAPIAGVLLGLAARGARIEPGDTLVEVDPDRPAHECYGVGDGSRSIAQSVLTEFEARSIRRHAGVIVL